MTTVEKMKDMGMKEEFGPRLSSKKNKKYYPSLSVEDMDMKGKSVGDEVGMHARCKIIEVSQEEGRPRRIRLEVKKAGLNGKNKEVENMPYHKDHKGTKGGMHKMPDGHMMKDSEMESSDKKEWGEKGWEKKKGKKVKKGKGKKGGRRGKKVKKEEAY